MYDQNNSRLLSDDELNTVSGGASVGTGCDGCGCCMNECPVEAIYMSGDGLAHINSDLCIECSCCVSCCPKGCIS